MSLSVLYITYNNFGDVSSGSGVRPFRIYNAFQEMGFDVKLLEGQQNLFRERKKKVALTDEWLKDNVPDYCYIELPTGPLFNRCDADLIKRIHAKGIPVGIFYRDLYWKYPEWSWPDMGYIKKKMLIHMQKRDLKLFKKNCDIVYFPSREVEEKFQSGSFRKTDILPPGCDSADRADFEMKKKVFYVGGVREADGIDDALEALDELNAEGKTVEFILVTKKEELRHLKRQDLLSAEWLTIAEGSGKELEEYYNQCDLGILPKKRHFYMDMAISVKALEFIAHNLPVLTTDCPAMARFVKENDCGIICSDNPDSIKAALMDYYTDNDKFAEMKKKTFEAAVNNSWQKRIEKITDDLIG